jgi:peptidoglycan/xylan/chitin deacetylase (PgdA/CDA1 family)
MSHPLRHPLRCGLLLSLTLLASAPIALAAAARPPTPIITITSPVAKAKYFQGDTALAQFSCQSATSCKGWQLGVQKNSNDPATPLDTSTLGSHAFAVLASNTVGGQTSNANKTINYTVVAPPPVTYGLTVSKGGTGAGTVTSNPTGIDCGTACSANYGSGTVVNLTATASTAGNGSSFAGWSGACSGTAACSVTMSAVKNVTATFNPLPPPARYALTVAKGGAGTGTVTSSPTGINCGGTCAADFNSGTVVTLTATPDSGMLFTGWSGDCSGTGTCSVTMGAAHNVAAGFDVAPPPPPGCTNGYVGLSYDDGPTSLSQQYVNALNAGGAHATFFNIGGASWDDPTGSGHMQQYSSTTAMEVANGNAVGDHSMDHQSFTGQSAGTRPLTDSQMAAEIQGQASLALSQANYTENLFRPPYGDMNQHTFDLVNSLGFTSVMWTYDTNDWKVPPTSAIVNGVVANARDQAVVLMHDGHTNTLNAIPGILSGLKSMGLCPGKIVPDPTNGDNQFDYNGLPMNLKVVAWPSN